MPIKAGDLPIGAKISVKVDGFPRSCTKIHQGIPSDMYDSSCDGSWFQFGYTYSTRYGEGAWSVTGNGNYALSDAHTTLKDGLFNLLDERVRNAIKTVKIPYCVPKGLIGSDSLDLSDIRKGSNGLSTKLFLLSGVEVGCVGDSYGLSGSSIYMPYDGTKLAIFLRGDSSEARAVRDEVAELQGWLRSPSGYSTGTYKNKSVCCGGGGYIDYMGITRETNLNLCPCFVLPNDFTFPKSTAQIAGNDRNLGTFTTTAPSASYTITDPSNFAQTVTEKLNGTVLRTYNAVLGREETATIPADKWLETLNGDYTLTITATDVDGMEVTRTFTFKKAMNTLEFSTKEAIQADEMPIKAILNVQGSMPTGSIFKAEICNNGNDAAPAWEDVTESVKSGEKFFFKNKIKTAEKWGVKVRISLQRGTATGPCYIQSVGGNFD